jgi:hypothetical protein
MLALPNKYDYQASEGSISGTVRETGEWNDRDSREMSGPQGNRLRLLVLLDLPRCRKWMPRGHHRLTLGYLVGNGTRHAALVSASVRSSVLFLYGATYAVCNYDLG